MAVAVAAASGLVTFRRWALLGDIKSDQRGSLRRRRWRAGRRLQKLIAVKWIGALKG